MPRAADGLRPLVHALVHPQQVHIGAVGGDLLGSQVVELKHVLDKLFFLVVDAAMLTAGVHHHADVLLAQLLLLLIGVDADEAQHTVGGHTQQRHDGREQLGDHRHQPGDAQGHLLRLLHGDALGHQLAEDQGKIRQDQRDNDDADGVQRAVGNGDTQADEPIRQPVGEVLRRESAAQEAGQRNGHLDGGQKAGGLGRQLTEPLGLAVSLGAHLVQLHLVHRQNGNLGAGKHGVEKDQRYLQKQ